MWIICQVNKKILKTMNFSLESCLPKILIGVLNVNVVQAFIQLHVCLSRDMQSFAESLAAAKKKKGNKQVNIVFTLNIFAY